MSKKCSNIFIITVGYGFSEIIRMIPSRRGGLSVKIGKKMVLSWTITALLMLSLTAVLPEASGDGGFIPTHKMNVYEPGQKAVIAWNGETERMYLSVDIYGDDETEGFHVVPFPSEPKVTLGDLRVFSNFTDLLPYYSYTDNKGGPPGEGSGSFGNGSIQMLFEEIIGVHDVTVIKVLEPNGFRTELMKIVESKGMDINDWPDELNDIIGSYTSRGFNYFCLDNFPISGQPGSIDPLMFEFSTDRLVFPLEISSMLEGGTTIVLGLLTPEDLPIDLSVFNSVDIGVHNERWISKEEVLKVDGSLEGFFDGGAHAFYVDFTVDLHRVKDDVFVPELERAAWMRSHRFDEWNYWSQNNDGRILELEDPYRSIIIDTGRSYRTGEGESYAGGTAVCLDRRTGYNIWELSPEVPDELTLDRRWWLLEDANGDATKELIVLDRYSNGSFSIGCFDTSDGGLVWSSNIPDRQMISWGELRCDHVKGLDGRSHLAILSSREFIHIDGKTGELISFIDYLGDMSYDVPHVVDHEMGGEVLILTVNSYTLAWSPTHCFQHDRIEEKDSITDPFHLWKVTGRIDGVFRKGDDWYGYLISERSIGILDLDNGDWLDPIDCTGIEDFNENAKNCVIYNDGEPCLYLQFSRGYDPGGGRETGYRIFTIKMDLLGGEKEWSHMLDAGENLATYDIEPGNDNSIVGARTYGPDGYGYVTSVLDDDTGEVLYSGESKVLGSEGSEYVICQKGGAILIMDLDEGKVLSSLERTDTECKRMVHLAEDLDGDGYTEVLYTESNRSNSADLMVYETDTKENYRIVNLFTNGEELAFNHVDEAQVLEVDTGYRLYGFSMDKNAVAGYKGEEYREESLFTLPEDDDEKTTLFVWVVLIMALVLIAYLAAFITRRIIRE